MVFMKNSVSNLLEKQGKTDYFVPALAILTGVLASFFLVKSGFLPDFNLDKQVAIFVICSAATVLIAALAGLHLFGFLLVILSDFLLGGLLMLTALETDGGWIVKFTVFFAVSLFSLLVSACSYDFSKKLLRRYCSETKFKLKLFKFTALTLGVILIIFSALFFFFKFNPELFI